MLCRADASLAQLHVQRAALYKTLCSFATTEADEGLEDAISDTKQVPPGMLMWMLIYGIIKELRFHLP